MRGLSRDSAYKSVISDPNAISYIAETGEVLFGDAIAKRLMELPADKELLLIVPSSSKATLTPAGIVAAAPVLSTIDVAASESFPCGTRMTSAICPTHG